MRTNTKLRPEASAELLAALAGKADNASFLCSTAICLHWIVAYHLAADADKPEAKAMKASVMEIVSNGSNAKGRAYRLRLSAAGQRLYDKLCNGQGKGKNKAEFNALVDAVADQSNVLEAHAAIVAWLHAALITTFDGICDYVGLSNRGKPGKGNPLEKRASKAIARAVSAVKDGKVTQAAFVPAITGAIPSDMLTAVILQAAERLDADTLLDLSKAFDTLANERIAAMPEKPTTDAVKEMAQIVDQERRAVRRNRNRKSVVQPEPAEMH